MLYISGFEIKYIPLIQSFQYAIAENNATVAVTGVESGMMIWQKTFHSDAPSIFAASTIASGMLVEK